MSTITIVGNLTGDPELRYTNTGRAVVNFTVAETPRFLDKTTGEWRDDETLFHRCSIWADAAEHVAASLSRGARVIVTGRMRARSYESTDEAGCVSKRTVFEVHADEVGPSLRWATAHVTKASRDTAASAGDDPWSIAPGVASSPAA